MNLIKQKLTPEQEQKTQVALNLINSLTQVSRDNGFRVIISGGYSADGFFGEVTRYHNDIDVQIYGTAEDARKTVDGLFEKINNGSEYTVEDRGRKEYYHYLVYKLDGLIIDVSYLQTKTGPLGKEKFIVKSNGEVDEQEFSTPIYGKLNGISFEITDPLHEMEDKIYKREKRGDPKRSEHDQDISNLKSALNM